MNRRIVTAALAAATFALPVCAAHAHVTLQPREAPAGGFTRLDVRVPNEEDAKATTKVVVQMPPGFAGLSYEPTPGWRATVAMRKLAEPVQTDDGELTEEVARVTFAATGRGIAPGQFQDFGLSLRIPQRRAGTKLTFKALQTYSGGEVVRWIGAPDSDRPAPQVTLTAGAATTAPATEEDDDGDGLALAALLVGALALLTAGAALLRAR